MPDAGSLRSWAARQSWLSCIRSSTVLSGARARWPRSLGEAGIGKSRLVWELTRSPRVSDWLILTGRSQSYSSETPYLPVVEILKGYFRLEASDDVAAIRSKVTGKLLSGHRALAPPVVPVLALLDVLSDDEEWQTLDPLARQQRTIEAIKQIFLQESRERPLLLVVEDLHWADVATQQLLDRLVSAFPTARIMLLVTSRPGHEPDFGDMTYYTPLRLHPLAPTGADDLLLGLLGNDASLGPVKRALIERTQGNPFFLEESVQALAEVAVGHEPLLREMLEATQGLVPGGNRCPIHRALERPQTCVAQKRYGFAPLFCLHRVMRQLGDVLGQPVGVQLLDGLDDPRVQCLASLLEKAGVHHLLSQHMFEGVFRLRKRMRLVQELARL